MSENESYKRLLEKAVKRNKEFDASKSVASKIFKKKLDKILRKYWR